MSIFVAVLVGTVGLAQLVVALRRQPRWLVSLLLVVSFLEGRQLSPSVTVSGVTITALDALVGAAALALLLQPRGLGSWHVKALFGLLIIQSLRGLEQLGFQTVMNSSRYLVCILVVVAFVSTRSSPGMQQFAERCWITSALVLVGVVALHYLGVTIGKVLDTRPLNATEALLLGQASLVALSRPRWWARWVGGVGLAVLLLAGQRTATLAVAVTALALLVDRRFSGTASVAGGIRQRLIGLIAFGSVVIALAPSATTSGLEATWSAVSGSSGTGGWRVESTVQLWSRFQTWSIFEQLFGQPLGAGFERVIGDLTWSVSPHNMYMYLLLGVGAAGLGCFLILITATVRRCREQPLMTALVIGIGVYGLGYQVPVEQAVFLGLALGLSPQSPYGASLLISGQGLDISSRLPTSGPGQVRRR